MTWPPDTPSAHYNTPCKYTLSKKTIGEGSYSTVYECKNIYTGGHYAAKKYTKRLVYGEEAMIQNELEALQKVSMMHPHIVTLIDYFETKQSLYLVTDLCRGGELFDRVTETEFGLEEPLVRKITATLVDTVRFLHHNHIVHRDIKAENILFQGKKSSNLLLCDFGCARVLSDGELLQDVNGTLSYIAPEILSREGHSYPVDIWAIGVVVYFMACGYMPFDCETDEETQEAIKNGEYYFEPEEYWQVSDHAKDFIRKCFTVDPKKRPTIDELATHAFLRDTNRLEQSSHEALTSRSHVNLQQLKESHGMFLRSPTRHQESMDSDPKINNKVISHSNLAQLNASLSKVLSKGMMASPCRSANIDSNDSFANSASHSSSASRLSLLEKSRSHGNDAPLKGGPCATPDMVSSFSTAIHSRVGSIESMAKRESMAAKMGKRGAEFYI